MREINATLHTALLDAIETRQGEWAPSVASADSVLDFRSTHCLSCFDLLPPLSALGSHPQGRPSTLVFGPFGALTQHDLYTGRFPGKMAPPFVEVATACSIKEHRFEGWLWGSDGNKRVWHEARPGDTDH
jgi:hypothetical protein